MPPIANDRDVQRARESVRAWRESLKPKQQPAPEGLLPPRTAPDTPNVARQYIENSPILSDKAKDILNTTTTETDYSQSSSPALGEYYHPEWSRYSPRAPWSSDVGTNGRIRVIDSPQVASTSSTAEHEAIHATQGAKPGNTSFARRAFDMIRGKTGTSDYVDSPSGQSIYADTVALADQGYQGAYDVLNHLDTHYGLAQMYPQEIQAYMGGGSHMTPAEIPPWYRQKHLSDVWSEDALNAQAPPLPDNRMSMEPRSSFNDRPMIPMSVFASPSFARQDAMDRAKKQFLNEYMWNQYTQDNPEWGPKSREEYFNYLRNNDRRYNGLIFGYG